MGFWKIEENHGLQLIEPYVLKKSLIYSISVTNYHNHAALFLGSRFKELKVNVRFNVPSL